MEVLSAQLTEAIGQVELQRATLEEIVLGLGSQAQQLHAVANVLTGAAKAQADVLTALQQGQAPAPAQLEPMARDLAAVSSLIGHASNAIPPLAAPAARARSSSHDSDDSLGRERGVWHTSASDASYSASRSSVSPGSSRAESPALGVLGRPYAPPRQHASPPPAGGSPAAAPAAAPLVSFGAAKAPIAPRPVARPRVAEPDIDEVGGIEYVSNLRFEGAAPTPHPSRARALYTRPSTPQARPPWATT